MHYPNIVLPQDLIEDAKNEPVPLKHAQRWAHARTHPIEEIKDRIKRHKKKLAQLQQLNAPECILVHDREKIIELENQDYSGLLVEVILYETVEEIIKTINANVKKNASIMEIQQWLTTNMTKITCFLRLQKDDLEKDTALEIVSEFIADTIGFYRADLVYKYMNTAQIAEYSAARDLEERGQEEEFSYLADKTPEEALKIVTEEILHDVKNGEDPGIHEVFATLKKHLVSVLREVLRFPPVTTTAN